MYATQNKRTVVVDIGTRYVKCGYAGEGHPRSVFPSSHFNEFGSASKKSLSVAPESYNGWCAYLSGLFRHVFYRILQCKPREVNVVVCELVSTTDSFRRACAFILLERFLVHSIQYFDSLESSLYVTGSDSGIVVDIGFNECRVGVVALGYLCSNSYFEVPAGSKHVLHLLDNVLKLEHEKLYGAGSYVALSCKSLEEIISQVCFCEGIKTSPQLKKSGARMSEKCAFNVIDINGSSREIEIDDSIRSSILDEVFFPSPPDTAKSDSQSTTGLNPEHYSREIIPFGDDLIGAFFKALRSTPVDNRLNAVRNVILCGGLAEVPGLCNRFVEEVKSAARDLASTYGSFKACVDQMHITNTRIVKANIIWAGASILGSLNILNEETYFRHTLSINEKQKDLSGDKNHEDLLENTSSNINAKTFQPHLLTRGKISESYIKWQNELVQISKGIDDMTTSPEKKTNSRGSALALFAAARWRRKVDGSKRKF